MELDNDLLTLWLDQVPTQEKVRALIKECQTYRNGVPWVEELDRLRLAVENLEYEVRELEDEVRELEDEVRELEQARSDA